MFSFWRNTLSMIITFFIFFLSSTNVQAGNDVPRFDGAEHILFGNHIKLFFSATDQGQIGQALHLSNGLNVTYGDIISFGDFYEIPNQPISLGQTDLERKVRFLNAFNSFASNKNAVPEATKILAILHKEQNLVEQALKRGEDPEKIYKQLGVDVQRQLNCVTGGGCKTKGWWLFPGRYLILADTDFDHFGENAWIAYKTGHDLAIAEAFNAHQTGDIQKLELAYAMNAFATHFLSDRFASGHIRTPRLELSQHVTPSVAGSILANYMHAEENQFGVHVHNLRGDHWIAYGDKSYYSEKNKQNRFIVETALQLSSDRIFNTFLRGVLPEEDEVYQLIPQADEVKDANQLDISPLFYWNDKSKKLMRRKDLENRFDRHFTANWWGWSTLVLLSHQRGLPKEAQGQLALSEFSKQAIQEGLITDRDIIAFINDRKA